MKDRIYDVSRVFRMNLSSDPLSVPSLSGEQTWISAVIQRRAISLETVKLGCKVRLWVTTWLFVSRRKNVNWGRNHVGVKGKDGQEMCFSFTEIFTALCLQYQIPIVKYGRENVMTRGIYLTFWGTDSRVWSIDITSRVNWGHKSNRKGSQGYLSYSTLTFNRVIPRFNKCSRNISWY